MSEIKKFVSEYAEALQAEGLLVDANIPADHEVSGVTFDSRSSEPGTMFVCKGAHFKSDYLEDAIMRGASSYVSEELIDVSISDMPYLIVSDIRKAMPVLAETFYGKLSEQISIVGITGTKGKSTTSFFLRAILDDYLQDKLGVKSAISSSIENYDGVVCEESHLTTPEIMDLYQHMENVQKSGIPYMTVEVSSQALKYNRVSGVEFEVACFLNIAEDHISPIEHTDFNDYFSSKLKIFERSRTACINMDADYYGYIDAAAEKALQKISFSTSDAHADVFGYNIDSVDGKANFDILISGVDGYKDIDDHIELAAYGTINVENALAAAAIAAAMRVPFDYVKSGLARAVVPGRMEVFERADGCNVIVDYAHNKLSFEQLFKNIKKDFPNRKTIVVFGAVGGKAYDRRREVGTVVGREADYAIITERLSADEDVNHICEEIAYYLKQQEHCQYEIITDRESAVERALEIADGNSIVICAGKGREKIEKHGLEIVPTPSDVDTVLRLLQ